MKTKKAFLVASFIILGYAFSAQTTTFQWAKNIGGSGNTFGYSISVDASGSIYTTGNFQGTSDFDPGVGVVNLTSAGADDVFISKIDSSGNFIWAKRIGGVLDDDSRSIFLDLSGNVYTTGWFNDTVDFDPGAGINYLSCPSSLNNIFISKLDRDGNFIWAKSITDSLDGYGLSIAVDDSGSVYTAGGYAGTGDFDPGAGVFNLSATPGTYSLFISKLDSSGNFVWAQNISGTIRTVATSIDIDVFGNVCIAGEFEGTADFDPGSGTVNYTTDTAGSDVFVCKLNASGDYVWAKHFEGSPYSDSRVTSIIADVSGNIYTTGDFAQTVDFDPGTGIFNMTAPFYGALFLSKLDPAGNFVSAKYIECTGGTARGNYLCTDAYSNIFMTGIFLGTIDLDPNAGVTNLTSAGSIDVFIMKLDSLGNALWGKQIGGTGYDWGTSLALDTAGNIHSTGYFQYTSDFDSGPNVYNITATGGQDAFIHKMSPSISFDDIEETFKVNDISIYPNLTHGIFNVLVENQTKNLRIEVYNNLGTLVHKKQITAERNTIELTDQANGLYFVVVLGNDKIIATKKIMKQ